MNETEALLADFKEKFQKTLNEAMAPVLERVREATQRVELGPQTQPQEEPQEEQISDAVQQWLNPNTFKEQAISEASDAVRQWLQGKEDRTNEGKQI